MDGSSRRLSWFDHPKRDEGYAALLSCSEQDLASSHAVKRFFGKFSFVRVYLFRHLLLMGFVSMAEKHAHAALGAQLVASNAMRHRLLPSEAA